MRGFPKKVATGQDLLNCLALVQAGELTANDLAEAIQQIEERKYITVPILSLSADRKTVKTMQCAEAISGARIKNHTATTITAAETADDETEPTAGGVEATKITTIVLSKPLPEAATEIKIAARDPFAEIGTTETLINSIKGVLASYE